MQDPIVEIPLSLLTTQKPGPHLITPRIYFYTQASLDNYLTVSNFNHQAKIKVTAQEVLANIVPIGFSNGVGAASAMGFFGVAKIVAGGSLVKYIAFSLGAFTLNWLVNFYFFNLVIAPAWASLFNNVPFEVKWASNTLQNLPQDKKGKLLRNCKNAALVSIILAPAVASAVPFFVLSKEGGDSDFTASIVFISSILLQYKGVELMVCEWVPALASPFTALYRRLNSEARRIHKVLTTVYALKIAHRDALSAAHREILKLLQINKRTELDKILELLKIAEPSKQDTLQLLKLLLKLGKEGEYQGSPTVRAIFQLASVISTIASLPGYYLKTVESTVQYGHLNDAILEWLVGSAIFLVSAALSLVIAPIVAGDIYSLTAYAWQGIKKSWQESAGFTDFIAKGWRNKANMASWYKIFKLPLPLQQNPRFMLGLLGYLYALAPLSTQSTTYLNEETLGEKVAYYFSIGLISVMLFNVFPVPKIVGKGQQFLTRLWGSQKNQDEIKLEQFIQNQIDFVDSIDVAQFLRILESIIRTDRLGPENIEENLQLFLGNKNAAEIFGTKHKYAKYSLSDIATRLDPDYIEELSSINFFSNTSSRLLFFRSSETAPLMDSKPKTYGITHSSILD